MHPVLSELTQRRCKPRAHRVPAVGVQGKKGRIQNLLVPCTCALHTVTSSLTPYIHPTHFSPRTYTLTHTEAPCAHTHRTHSPTHFTSAHTYRHHTYSTQCAHHTPIPRQTHNGTFTLQCFSLRKVSVWCPGGPGSQGPAASMPVNVQDFLRGSFVSRAGGRWVPHTGNLRGPQDRSPPKGRLPGSRSLSAWR